MPPGRSSVALESLDTLGHANTMKAILTKYIGPTNTRPSRIKASDCDGNSVTISCPHELSGEACFRKAADALCQKMGWKGPLVGGGLKNDWVFCFADGCPEVQSLVTALGNATPYVAGECEALAGLGDPDLEESTQLAEQAHADAENALQPFTR